MLFLPKKGRSQSGRADLKLIQISLRSIKIMGDVCKRISHMRFLQTAILVLILVPFKICQADDILGCGGFLRSLVDIEYSKVQVKL